MSIALACVFIPVVKCSVCIIIQLQNGQNNLTPFWKKTQKGMHFWKFKCRCAMHAFSTKTRTYGCAVWMKW